MDPAKPYGQPASWQPAGLAGDDFTKHERGWSALKPRIANGRLAAGDCHYRHSRGMDGRHVRALNVRVDGEVMAAIPHKGVATIDVRPGRHSVSVKMDWVESDPLEFSIAEGETVALEAGSTNPLFAFFGMGFWVRRMDGTPPS